MKVKEFILGNPETKETISLWLTPKQAFDIMRVLYPVPSPKEEGYKELALFFAGKQKEMFLKFFDMIEANK
jgi:hypothetical protein